jgi:hypothetical protein
MKKFSLKPQIFGAIIFSGNFADVDAAANAAHEGSGTTFEEVQSEKGTVLNFTDANGNQASAHVGDALKESFCDGSFNGWLLADASIVANDWQEETEAA